jgi:hypothetical protein
MNLKKIKDTRQLKDDEIIAKTLNLIKKQTGLDLKLDPYFVGMSHNPTGDYFNVILDKRTSESEDYTKLESFANKYKLIKIEPNGLRRVAIFINW